MIKTSTLISCLLILTSSAFSQSSRLLNLRNVDFNINNEKKVIEIEYDIDNVDPKDSIYVRVFNNKQKYFPCSKLEGDIGQNITGGTRKKIIWDFIADNFNVDEDITITVYVKLYNSYKSNPKPPKVDDFTNPTAKTEKTIPPTSDVKVTKTNNSRTIALLGIGVGTASLGGYLIIDGLKQRKLANNDYQSYIANNWNQKIIVNDDEWLKQYSEGTISNAKRMLDKAQSRLKKSTLLLGVGIGLIAADLTFFTVKLLTQKSKSFNNSNMSISYSNSSGVTLTYKF
ncbi:MAG: hypothetical protein ACK4NY_08220 [Spirosomataceae bacterium]